MTPEIEKRIKAVRAGRVPAGYKKTPIGVVPKEWNMTSLKDIANHVIEKNKNNAVHLTLTNSATKGVIKQEDYFDKQISNNENTDGYYLVKDGDFIYNPRISESAPCGPINRSHIGEIGIASPLYTVFRLKENVQNVDYIELYLKSPFWHRYMCGVANYGARHDRMNITNDDLFAMPLPLPPIGEQKRIAEILATQDKVIELKEKLIAEKQGQKKYLMQYFFKEKQKKCTIVKFHEMFSRVIRKNEENNQNVLTISAQYGLVSQNDFFSKSIASEDKTNYFLLNKGEFAYNKSYSNGYPFGTLKRLEKYDKGIVSPLYICFAAKPNNKNPNFFVHYFEAGLMNKEIKSFAQEGARNHGLLNISVEDFFNSNLYIPSLSEQKVIAEVLSAADEEISLLQKGLEQEKLKKKSLMQLLLTGLVRVQ